MRAHGSLNVHFLDRWVQMSYSEADLITRKSVDRIRDALNKLGGCSSVCLFSDQQRYRYEVLRYENHR